MIRRFNYTGRKRIPRSRVTVRLRDDRAGRSFDADIDLTGLGLPADAEVFVEAYHRSAHARFAFGTVESLAAPRDRQLNAMPTASPLFRLKVVSREKGLGKIVAAADKIAAVPADAADDARIPLLFVDYEDLGDRVWRLELDDQPILKLNAAMEGVREAARSGDEFLALVYPDVVERVLRHILDHRRDAEVDSDDDYDWAVLWLRYACRELGRPEPPAETEDATAVGTWVEDAVEAFCSRQRVPVRFQQIAGQER